MLSLIIALLATVAPPEGEKTWQGKLCAHDPGRNILVGADTYYSYGAAKVWAIRSDKLILVDQARLKGARDKTFYVNNEPVTLNGKTFVKYGLPRVLTAAELNPRPFGARDGVPFYLAKEDLGAEVAYLLTQPVGCEFQPYVVKR
ncbi:MAG: hypothetical protein EON95_20300 [Caulobacteraceae bacterium]|nr:MAG: hypothetical protein EON95_20300 [Caulobacteraceae bacterium]